MNTDGFLAPVLKSADLLKTCTAGSVSGESSGTVFTAARGLSNYRKRIFTAYPGFEGFEHYEKTGIPSVFNHFGLSITFDEVVELDLHDEDMRLAPEVKAMVRDFGVLVFRNTVLNGRMRDLGHRNRFPQLNFHIDRNPAQVTRYSLYTRDPFDHEQYEPRTSSTLFIPTLVAVLQANVEQQKFYITPGGTISNITLFSEQTIRPALGNIVLEQAWNAPRGTGEIVIADNANVMHASYYPDPYNKGYRIGVRYVG